MSIGPLIEPPKKTDIENAIENAELMIAESVADILAIRDGGQAKRPSHNGVDYDEAYAQGRKDACRVILLSFGIDETATTVRS